jgi:tRNA(fMet)-specific endonuclease VapC
MIYALDTNTIILLLNNENVIITRRDKAVLTGAQFIIPPIVDYEIQRGLMYKPSPKKEAMYRNLVNHYGVGEMTAGMWKQAAYIYVNLWQKGFTVGDDDIFIAAFCIENGYTFVTRNTKDFENINELQFENWVIPLQM